MDQETVNQIEHQLEEEAGCSSGSSSRQTALSPMTSSWMSSCSAASRP
jgi:hypothetical protein